MSFLARSLRLGNVSSIVRIGSIKEDGYILRISKQLMASDSTPAPLPKEALDKMTKSSKVVVFMKGVPAEPKCGFSNAVVQILRMHGVDKYDSHNVLTDEAIRQGIKEYTNWPTIPQIFINGEFVGGCDIMIQMHQSGDLIKELEKAGIKSALKDADIKENDSKEK